MLPVRGMLVAPAAPPGAASAPALAELPSARIPLSILAALGHLQRPAMEIFQQRDVSSAAAPKYKGSPSSQHALLTSDRWMELVWEEEEGRWQSRALQSFWCVSAKLLKQMSSWKARIFVKIIWLG